jgi:hypothetical protein
MNLARFCDENRTPAHYKALYANTLAKSSLSFSKILPK